jgi:hypothetical protein
MPAVKIAGLGQYLPEQLILSSELDLKLNRASGSVQKNQGLFHATLLQLMKQLLIWAPKRLCLP